MVNNYLLLNDKLLLHKRFMYIDAPEDYALGLFIKHNVNFQIETMMVEEESAPYRLVFCKIRKKDVPKIHGIMEELRNVIVDHGGQNYDKYCSMFFELIEKER